MSILWPAARGIDFDFDHLAIKPHHRRGMHLGEHGFSLSYAAWGVNKEKRIEEQYCDRSSQKPRIDLLGPAGLHSRLTVDVA